MALSLVPTADVPGPLPVAPDAAAGMPTMPGVPAVAPAAAAPIVAPAAPPIAVVPPTGTPEGIAAASSVQQQAALDEAAAKKQAADDEAAAQEAARVAHEAEAEEARQLAARQALAQDEAHRQTQSALDAANAKQIPDFWAGREGKRAEMAIWVGLGAAGAALAGIDKNSALDILTHAVDSHYRREKEKIDNLFTFAARKGQDEDNLRQRHAQELAGLQAKFGATKLALAARIDKQAALGKGRVDVANAAKLSAQLRMDGEEAIVKAKSNYALINLHNAEAARARAAKSEGGSPAATAAEAKVMAAIEGGMPGSKVRELAASLGVKGPRVDALENQGRAASKAGAGGTVDPKLVVRDVSGDPIGLASSAKSAPVLNTQIRNFHDAIDKLKRVRAAKWTTSRSPEFHDAVLAVATTTTAGSTDANVAHEKGTLTNALGIPSNDAIDTKIAELENRLGEMKNQLNPLPDGYTDAKSAPKGGAARSYTAQDDQALAWANANAADPRAKKIHEKQGR